MREFVFCRFDSAGFKQQKGIAVKKLILIPLLIMTGCVNIESISEKAFNVPSSGISQFDETKHIRMSEMACSNISFELYQDTAKQGLGVVLLSAGARSDITNIGKGKSLLIKLDGELFEFESHDILTERDTVHLGYGVTMTSSTKSYVVPEVFVRKASEAQTFLAKVRLLNNSYIEGKCSALTLEEHESDAQKFDPSYKASQKDVDRRNRYSAQEGFREFAKMMDTTKW